MNGRDISTLSPSHSPGVLFLIGYMGSGKTTLGKEVARRTAMPFIDLDDYIVNASGYGSVNAIFAAEGEEGFRRRERQALEAVAATPRQSLIVACGGGTPCQPGNMEVMHACGISVWLDCPEEVLFRRLRQGRDARPLLRSLDDDALRSFIAEALEKRRPYYSRADHRFPSDRLEDASQVAGTASRFIARFITSRCPAYTSTQARNNGIVQAPEAPK